MTAVLPRGLPAASTTYHLRTMLPLFAIKVDMVFFLQYNNVLLYFFILPCYNRGREKTK